MPDFQYQAIDASGKYVSGVMNADTAHIVMERLRNDGMLPIDTRSAAVRSPRGLSGKRGTIDGDTVTRFTRELASTLLADLTLDRALSILDGDGVDQRMRVLATKAREAIRKGSSFADALAAIPGFSPTYLSMVRAGEAGGVLAATMSRLADHLERSRKLKDSIVSALIYPALLLVLTLVSVLILMIWVIPQFETMFEDMGADIPLISRIVIETSRFLENHMVWIPLLIGGLLFSLRMLFMYPVTRTLLDHWLLTMPLSATLCRRVETARFTRTLSTLVGSGVPIIAAIELSASTSGNRAFSKTLENLSKEVHRGGSLSSAFSGSRYMPLFAAHLVGVGEETGRLAEMLERIAMRYEGEVSTLIDRLLSILVPALVLVMAVIIATIVMAILLAILSINDLVI